MSGNAPGPLAKSTRAPAMGCPSLLDTTPVISAGSGVMVPPPSTSRRQLGLPRDHVVVHLADDSRARVRGRAPIAVDRDRHPRPVDQAVYSGSALATGGVDVVIDLAAVHRCDLPRVIPLRTRRFVAGVSADVPGSRNQICVRVHAKAEPAHSISQFRGDDDGAVIESLVAV